MIRNFLFTIMFFPIVYGQDIDTASVYFEFDRYDFDELAPPGVALMSQMVDEGIFEIIAIKSYSDTLGSTSYNNALADKRLHAVEEVLGSSALEIVREVVGEKYNVTNNYRSSDYRRVDIIYEVHENEIKKEPVIEPMKEKSELVKSFESFLTDTVTTETTIRLDIHFYPGQPVLLPESEPELWELFDFMHYNQNVTAFIRGHVCCSDDYYLSYQRAEVVYDFLKDRGISMKRLDYKGFSNTIPAVSPEETDEDRRMNRRVDVIFTKEG